MLGSFKDQINWSTAFCPDLNHVAMSRVFITDHDRVEQPIDNLMDAEFDCLVGLSIQDAFLPERAPQIGIHNRL